jgi:signal transduction histidine kinase
VLAAPHPLTTDKTLATLHTLARGQPLYEMLAALAQSLEAQQPGHRAAIFLIQQDPLRAVLGAAPSFDPPYALFSTPPQGPGLPAPFAAALEASVGPSVQDVLHHPAWAEHREALAIYGIRSVWLQPVYSFDGSTLGLVVIHLEQLAEPTLDDCQWLSTTAKLVALGILRDAAEVDRLQLRKDLDSERVERDALNLELQQAARAREEFMCIAAHELRTPLAALMLQADSAARIMHKKQVDPLRLQGKVTAMQKQIDRLKHLVEGLLDQSQIADGKLQLNLDEVDLVQITQEAILRVADAYKRAHCDLQLRALGPVVGNWDALRLGQVVNNLLVNALKYGQGKPIDVLVQGTPDSGMIQVVDRGIGIPRSAQRRIFQRFGRAVSETHFGGFGMGLWLCKLVIDGLGGSITVQSEADAGATFTVVLPRQVKKYFATLAL